MQDLSFYFKNTVFKTGNRDLEVMIYTFTNAYSLDPECTKQEKDGNKTIYHCSGFLTCGGQEKAKGKATVEIREDGQSIAVDIFAQIENITEEIRRVKLSIHGMEYGKIINRIDAREKDYDELGIRLRYPQGWREVGTPLLILKHENDYSYFKSLDERVRDKAFVFFKKGDKADVELLFEEEAIRMSNSIKVPTWVFGKETDIDKIYQSHIEHIQKAYHLSLYEERKDVPDWFKDISLVVSIHGQHWTGYIFNDYEEILNKIKYFTERIDPKRILFYLPGFEGRYYWQYGNYGPDERMGGEEKFRYLFEEARKLGVHMMPMFGINGAGVNHDNYIEWGENSEMTSVSGNKSKGFTVDWDGSRHYDDNSVHNLNPGAPKWQNRLCSQITYLVKEYGFEAIFLDIASIWLNDPNHNVYEGIKEMVARLHKENPDLLVAGEGWYDGLLNPFPLLQCGHTDGKMHYFDEAYAPMFDSFAREFSHLCLGDPSRGSTGVHELGTNPEWRTPLRKGIIPTVTVVDDTIEKVGDKVDLIISDAKEYARRYL